VYFGWEQVVFEFGNKTIGAINWPEVKCIVLLPIFFNFDPNKYLIAEQFFC